MFEPKPLQKPWPPLHCGGESPAALRRAALHCDGWYGLVHDVESAAARVRELRRLLREAGREGARFEVSLGGEIREAAEVRRWEDAGVDRLVLSPWRRSPECIEGLRRTAERVLR
jgi:alkanesulfonate monooxygenase SsuD/methylene tetrahydromethanopterin reductase-like flavin-dependent oxidoreductase (luciferase family)